MKKERDLIKLAGQKVSVDDIAAKLKTTHITIRNGELLVGLSQEEAVEIKDQLEQYFSGGSTA